MNSGSRLLCCHQISHQNDWKPAATCAVDKPVAELGLHSKHAASAIGYYRRYFLQHLNKYLCRVDKLASRLSLHAQHTMQSIIQSC